MSVKREWEGRLDWPELIPGILVKRYRRFLADVELQNGQVVTAHCPNTGSMKGCSEPGRSVFLSFHDNPRRKLPYTWQLIRMPSSLVGVNTQIPNRLVSRSIRAGRVTELRGYDDVRREVKVGNGSRIDLLLTGDYGKTCYVEIKNCTLVANRIAFFPDALTVRGRKHLTELRRLHAAGNRCVMFFLVQRMDARAFRPAEHIDPAYAEALWKAEQKGVEILAYDADIDLKAIRLRRRIPIIR